jgi:very-short-patch-repair endonuclease
MTESEQLLWLRVRRKQVADIQFYRQRPIAGFVVDFYAPSAKLVVEVDGSQHFAPEGALQDRRRDLVLQELGLRVLRFDSGTVLRNIDAVIEVILGVVVDHRREIPPHPPFPKGGTEGTE